MLGKDVHKGGVIGKTQAYYIFKASCLLFDCCLFLFWVYYMFLLSWANAWLNVFFKVKAARRSDCHL